MNIFKRIVVYVIVITILIFLVLNKAEKDYQKIQLITESAIEYGQSIYRDINFEMLSWNYNRETQTYIVTLINKDNKTMKLHCIVDPAKKMGDYYDVEIFGSVNLKIKKPGN